MADAGDDIRVLRGNWSFAGDVASHFDDHVVRSIPLYAEGHQLIAWLSDHFLPAGSTCYELGSATGRCLELLGRRHAHRDVRFVGIDNQERMVQRARERCRGLPAVSVIQEDVLAADFEDPSLVISYYTCHFIPSRDRQALFNRIGAALHTGGAFLLFEKVLAPDARLQHVLSSLYTDYKREQGYTAEEILAKADSLKGVLEPLSSAANQAALREAGFSNVTPVFRYACFEGYLAIR